MPGVVLMLAAAAVLLQDPVAPASLRARRAATPPAIDGRLDDAVWTTADVGNTFRQYEPEEGQPATERTELRILYDNTSLYVGVRLFDGEPDKIVKRLSRRDDQPDADRFTFYVDALHDKLTGASFEVSAGGAQRDTIISNDTNRDSSWDGVWESAVSIDSEGWTIEMRIPLSQLRFLRGDRQTWGFNAERFIYRKNERVWFHLIPRTDNALMSRAADLTGIDGVEPRRTLELMPYTAARSEFVRPGAPGNPFNDGSRYFGATGVDIKYAPRPNIIVNAAINPDFGQVEIDPAVVNLGAFETFFQEKRPFFIEGAQIFSNFGGLGANNGWGFNRSEPILVHTRRLGRVPQGAASGEFVDRPTATTILGAAKMTGKSNNGWSFGVLDAVTDREHTRTSTFGQQSRVETEPLTNYFAGRVLKEWGSGRSGLGGLVTSVRRDLHDAGMAEQLTGRSDLAGVDGYHFLDSGKVWVVNGRYIASHVSGSAAAVERLQLAPQRFYQRTETPEVSFDPTRTSLSGWNGSVNLNKNQGGWTVNTAVWSVSPGFEAGDLGFHFNGDVWGSHGVFQWRQTNPDRVSRDRNISIAKFYVWNHGGVQLGDGAFVFGNLTFRNYWNIGGNVAGFWQAQDDRLTRGGPPSLELPSAAANLYLNSDSRKRVVLHLNGGTQSMANGGTASDGSLSVEWKPSPQLNLSTGPSYQHQVNMAQYVLTADDPAASATHGKRYVFARLQQKVFSVDTRVNVLFTPKASLQVYMQPLIVVGDYLDFKSLAAPKTFDFEPYANVPFDPDFNFKSLRLNAIFRWEWRLGSTLFVAWTQQRQDLADPGQLQFRRDFGRVFTGPADNVFMIKATRWFGR